MPGIGGNGGIGRTFPEPPSTSGSTPSTFSGTGTLLLNDLVYVDSADDVSRADASNPAKMPAIGFVSAIGSGGQPYTVQSSGELAGFSDLTPGETYYAGAAGAIVTAASVVGIVQPVGVAKDDSTLLVAFDLPQSGESSYGGTGPLVVNNLVYVASANTVARADQTNAAKMPALGFLSYIDVAEDTPSFRIKSSGELGGFSGLTPGATYYAGVAGAIVTPAPGSGVVQPVGIAKNATTLAIAFDLPQSSGGSVPASIEQEIRFAIGVTTGITSATSIPANAIVTYAALAITTPYSTGAISVGRTGATTLLFVGLSASVATAAGLYAQDQDTAWGASALPVLITISGGPTTGAGFCIVRYVTTPDA